MLEREREALIAEIKKAFKKVPYPKNISGQWRLWDLEGKHWDELTVGNVISNNSFVRFSQEGFHYFLPGYMVIMLQNPEKMLGKIIVQELLECLGQEYTYSPKVFNILEVTQLVINVGAQHAAPVQKPPQVRKS